MAMPGEWMDENNPVSSSTRRVILLNAYGQAWEEFRTTKNEFITKVALKTGNVFPLCDDRIAQFAKVKLRGYTKIVGVETVYKNPFEDKSFDQCFIDYKKRTADRKKRQAARKKRKEENIAEKIRKRKERELKKKERQKKEAQKKKRQRARKKAEEEKKNKLIAQGRRKENQRNKIAKREKKRNSAVPSSKKRKRVPVPLAPAKNLKVRKVALANKEEPDLRKKKRNIGKENFEDRRIIAEKFFDLF